MIPGVQDQPGKHRQTLSLDTEKISSSQHPRRHSIFIRVRLASSARIPLNRQPGAEAGTPGVTREETETTAISLTPALQGSHTPQKWYDSFYKVFIYGLMKQ